MRLFDEANVPKKKGKFWKIIELKNSYKFQIGAIEEYIEIDELLGRGSIFLWQKLSNKVTKLV